MEPSAPARVIAAVAGGIVGAAIGSFLNVVIYRVPRGMSVVRPRSHCPRCGTELGDIENVPVISWVVLRGRCRHCKEPISARYPIVELTTAALFVAFPLVLRSFSPVASLDCLGVAALAAALIALDHLPVPRSIALTAVLGATSLALVSVADHGGDRLLWAAVAAAAAVVGAVFLPWLVQRLDGRGSLDPGRLALATVLVSLSWGAGWLWRPGGLIVAGIAAASCTVGVTDSKLGRLLPGAACLAGLVLLVPAGPLGHA
jgi:leader peptidase (prepilin peptidase) / N-methyltransferase